MSFREGTKNSDAPFYLFRHNDAEHLEKLIRKNGPGVVVVESVYSTIGTVSPLVDIIDVAIQYHCVSVVDESHSLGIYGPYGSGLVAALDLTEKVHFVTASLSKAFAGRAGIIFCNHTFAKYYPYVAYPAIFSSTLLLPEIAGLFATLDSMIHANERRQDLHKNADYLRSGLKDLEYNIKSQSPIIALESGTEHQTEILRDALENRNVFGSVFCAPATPKNRSLIRFSLNSNLQRNELDHILSVCAEVREEVGMWDWRSTRGKKIVLNKR